MCVFPATGPAAPWALLPCLRTADCNCLKVSVGWTASPTVTPTLPTVQGHVKPWPCQKLWQKDVSVIQPIPPCLLQTDKHCHTWPGCTGDLDLPSGFYQLRATVRGHFSTCPKPQPLELAARGELPGVPADSSVRSSQVPHAPVTAAHPPGVPWLCPLPARSECGTHIPTATAHAGSPSCQQVMDGRCEGRGRALLAPLSPPVTASWGHSCHRQRAHTATAAPRDQPTDRGIH